MDYSRYMQQHWEATLISFASCCKSALTAPNYETVRAGLSSTLLSRTAALSPIHSLLLQRNQVRTFAAILNAQDNEGNTALHFAVRAGRPGILHQLIWHKEVHLNLQNKKGQTALDLSWSHIPSGVFFGMVRYLVYTTHNLATSISKTTGAPFVFFTGATFLLLLCLNSGIYGLIRGRI
jgi:hypothetical protein